MGRKSLAVLVMFCATCWLAGHVSADMMRAAPGTAALYPSPNGRFIVKAAGPGGVSLREGDKILWSEPFLDVSKAAVSDDGGTVAVTLWGWKDEGGSEAIAFYDGKGALIGKESFGGPLGSTDKGAMKWVKRLVLSPDGVFCALGENGKEKSRVTLYNARKGVFLWERLFGLEEIESMAIHPSGRIILIATRGRDTQDMLYLLSDAKGEIVWNKKVRRNFTYDVKDLCRFSADGKQLEVYVDAEKRHLAFPVPTDKLP